MCKVFIVTGIQQSDKTRLLMESVKPQMSLGNRDGIGYTAVTNTNKMFMQRWHENDKFLDTETVLTYDDIKNLEPYKAKLPRLSANHETVGEVDLDNVTSFTMHTRFATCGKTFENTHPFVVGDFSLIHNGIIRNANKLNLNKISTCDSENALQVFMNKELNVNTSPENLQSFVDELEGYWAFGIFSKGSNGQFQLDVVKDGAQLSFAYLPELGTNCVVFATEKAIIEDACKGLGISIPEINTFKDHSFHRFNALTGKIKFITDIEESKLNKRPVYSGYNRSWNYYWEDDKEDKYATKTPKQSGYTYNNQDMLTYLSDTTIELFDRLELYDEMTYTTYSESFMEMPHNLKRFLEKREEAKNITIEQVIDLIDEYVSTRSIKSVFSKYKVIMSKVA